MTIIFMALHNFTATFYIGSFQVLWKCAKIEKLAHIKVLIEFTRIMTDEGFSCLFRNDMIIESVMESSLWAHFKYSSRRVIARMILCAVCISYISYSVLKIELVRFQVAIEKWDLLKLIFSFFLTSASIHLNCTLLENRHICWN